MICHLLPWLNTAGQALGMIGVIVLFVRGPLPPPLSESGLLREDYAEVRTEQERTRQQYKRWSTIGLALIFLGFLGQFVGSLPPLQHP